VKGHNILLLVSVLVLLITAGFFATAETALTRMNRIKAMTLVEEHKRGSDALLHLVEQPAKFLNPVLFLVLVCHLVAATLVGVVSGDLFGPWGVAAATAFEVVVIFVFAEAAPKTWAVQHTERAALRVAPLVWAVVRFPPLQWLANGLIGLSKLLTPGTAMREGPYVSEEELLALADVAHEEEVIEGDERRLIHSIIDFGDTVAREVMKPRTDMVAVEARARVEDVLEVAFAAGYSRIPVYEAGIDDIVGIVYTKDLMRAERDDHGQDEIRRLARPAYFVPETKRVSQLMREMQKTHTHMAIVVDEYGGTAGLVTLEDLLEELVGEIVDEYDVEEPPVEQLGEGQFRVTASLPIDEVSELLGAELPEGDWDTVGGFLYSLLGHMPTEGESVRYDGHLLTAERVEGRRIGRVRIDKLTDEPAQ
jgi:CBS domain containing-hemolysin-like protein